MRERTAKGTAKISRVLRRANAMQVEVLRRMRLRNSRGGTRTHDPGIMSAVEGRNKVLALPDSASIRPRELTRADALVLPSVLPSSWTAPEGR